MRAVLLAMALPAFVTPADAQVREVIGQAGAESSEVSDMTIELDLPSVALR